MKNVLKPSKIKIMLDVVVSLGIVLAIVFLPTFGFGQIFGRLSLEQKIISFLLSWALSCVIYYPLICGLVYLADSAKNSVYKVKEIILALMLIAIFNPMPILFVVLTILGIAILIK